MSSVPYNLSLPVPYTLRMLGNGSFVAEWNPKVKTAGLPDYIRETSRTSGINALERLIDSLVKASVIAAQPAIKCSVVGCNNSYHVVIRGKSFCIEHQEKDSNHDR